MRDTEQDSAASCKIVVYCMLNSKEDRSPSKPLDQKSLACFHGIHLLTQAGYLCMSKHATSVFALFCLTAPFKRSTSSKETHEHTTWAAWEARLPQHSLLSFAVLRQPKAPVKQQLTWGAGPEVPCYTGLASSWQPAHH